jgi:hypothetical protein
VAIELDELQRAVTSAEPSAILVPARILRRVVKLDRGLRWLGGARPSWYVISGEALRAILDGPELGRPRDAPLPVKALLIAQPEPEELAATDRSVVLISIWRRLFAARVEAEMRWVLEQSGRNGPALEAQIEAVGRTEFEEARTVLLQDGLLLPNATTASAYALFAAAYLDLTFFEPAARSYTFPAIECLTAVQKLLAQDLDAERLLAKTRPAGAAEPATRTDESGAPERADLDPADELREEEQPTGEDMTSVRSRMLAARARAAAKRGNSVRSAILWTQLEMRAAPGKGSAEHAAARSALRQLAVRLRKALFVQKGETAAWVAALLPLLARAAREFWSPERRLLHDLQNVCLDHEREVFRLEPIGWLISLGRRPLLHPLPHLREVTMSKHLRAAAKRLRQVRLPRAARARLEGLLQPAVHRAEEALRQRFRPWVDRTLETVWVCPANLPERVAYRKLVEQMLDPIVARGFTTLGNLRDAASQSNLKLSDLESPAEFLRGDRLLQADRALAEALDGVHRRGEIYLRWLERLSAAAFGTGPGRFLTLYAALPFGGAFVLLKGLEEINEVMVARFTGAHVHLVNAESIFLLGLLTLGIINYVRFRRGVLAALRAIVEILRVALLDLPARLITHPLLRRLLQSPITAAAWRYLLKPGLAAAPVWVLARVAGLAPAGASALGLLAFLAASFAFNTRTGRALEEAAIEHAARVWHAVIFRVLPGLFRIIMSAFERGRDWVEKLIYAVDEWLRFREGQSRGMLAIKAVLGLLWGIVAYTARIYVNLLIEPEINPIKHFPVVTVAAKIMLPFALTLNRIVAAPLVPFLGSVVGQSIAAVTVFFLPGVFGFLVWEFRSNWRLYEANRPQALGPLAVGSHGETVVRFLRVGFHSGTLPKLFARLRRTRQAGRERSTLKRREALHHVEESVRRLLERDVAGLLHESLLLRDWSIEPGVIHLATNRIRVEMLAGAGERSSLWIDLEERSGVLAAGISQAGWLENCNPEQRRTLSDAVAGLYKLSGVELVHTPGAPVCHAEDSHTTPQALRLIQRPVRFSDVVIPWHAWVEEWEAAAEGIAESGERAWRVGILPERGPAPIARESAQA